MLLLTLFSNSGENSVFSETLEDKTLRRRKHNWTSFPPTIMLAITKLILSLSSVFPKYF